MPTYEYLCTSCGNRLDVFQRIDEDAPTICEKCGGALRKVFHPAGIVFKGSGFYATDSRTASKRAGDKGGDKSDDKSDDKSGDKADKKDGDAGTKEESKNKGDAKKKGDTSTSTEKAG